MDVAVCRGPIAVYHRPRCCSLSNELVDDLFVLVVLSLQDCGEFLCVDLGRALGVFGHFQAVRFKEAHDELVSRVFLLVDRHCG